MMIHAKLNHVDERNRNCGPDVVGEVMGCIARHGEGFGACRFQATCHPRKRRTGILALPLQQEIQSRRHLWIHIHQQRNMVAVIMRIDCINQLLL